MFKKYILNNRHDTIPTSGRLMMVKYYFRWVRSNLPSMNSMDDQMPWIIFEARDYLKKILKPSMRVFEYGTGGSSLFFANNSREVIGVEHDELWFSKVQQSVSTMRVQNFFGFLYPPTPINNIEINPNYADPDSYLSSDEKFLNKFSFYNYASSIDQYEDNSFDIVSVDGRARPSCIKHALPKIKRGGFLILDNSDRSYYVELLTEELKHFTKVFDKFGPGPYNQVFWGTTIYKKN